MSLPDLIQLVAEKLQLNIASEPDMKLLMVLGKSNCLFGIKFCFIRLHDDFIAKTNSGIAVLRTPISSGCIPSKKSVL